MLDSRLDQKVVTEKQMDEESLKCLSMHQPWASLLVHGIKRIEGRDWKTDFRGRLWIHATKKVSSDVAQKGMTSVTGDRYGPSTKHELQNFWIDITQTPMNCTHTSRWQKKCFSMRFMENVHISATVW